MDGYLGKILELGIDEGDEVNLSEKQTKEIISQKLVSQGGKKKKKRGKHEDHNHGMTEEELAAEQKRLFDNAKNYDYDDDGNENENGSAEMAEY